MPKSILRSSLSIARTFLHQICKVLCKSGDASRNAMLTWFGAVLNLNKKRIAMHVDYTDVSGDGFMLNVVHVLLCLVEPVVQGGWKVLERVDPTYPQSAHRINYTDETRLAADSDLLKRWWVDQRNPNAQESLTRALEHAAQEAQSEASSSAVPDISISAASNADDLEQQLESVQAVSVSTDFKFVTEIFFLTHRAVQLGFVPVSTLYSDTVLKSLGKLKDLIRDLEADSATPSPDRDRELSTFKARFDSLLQVKFCYDVYLRDEELASSLVQFASGTAGWLVKKLLAQPTRSSLLPLPTPPQAVFASLPEHIVESWTVTLRLSMTFSHLALQPPLRLCTSKILISAQSWSSFWP
jgi:Ubiquitin elongating factor core